jgi:triosephosphate isomerase (TIM)
MRAAVVAGNWKMVTTPSEAVALVQALKPLVAGVSGVEVAVCPPFTNLVPVGQELKGSAIRLGGQNMHWEDEGAFTGEISAKMLLAAGCHFVILGHSERRQYFGETDEKINRKIRKALASGLFPIVCAGETLAERESGITEQVIRTQLEGCFSGFTPEEMKKMVVAYEPVWAIGTGKTATPEQAQDVHRFIRSRLSGAFGKDAAESIRIQYGGSVKADNAKALLSQPDIDGALVGGASLKADQFAAIVRAAV